MIERSLLERKEICKKIRKLRSIICLCLVFALLSPTFTFAISDGASDVAEKTIFDNAVDMRGNGSRSTTYTARIIQGNRFETLFILTLFTGMREGEVLGLTWDCIDFHTGIISVEKQMQLHQDKGSKGYELVSPKNGRSRTIAAAQTVLTRLQQQRRWQMQQKLLLGSDWQNPEGLVFTNEFGTHLTKPTVYREYKRIVAAIGCPNARFHDLRHSYAVAAIRAGDDIKTVQGNLGHATAAFTLDVYGHVTDQMKRESADRMERFIRTVSAD